MNFSALKAKFFPVQPESGGDTPFKEMDILDHIENIVEITQKQGIEKGKLTGKKHINYVAEKLSISPLQTILFSLLLERAASNQILLSEIAESIKCSKVRIIKYITECEELEKKKLIRCSRSTDCISYRVPRDVRESLRKYNEYRPEKKDNLSIGKLFAILGQLFRERENEELTFENLTGELLDLFEQNKHLEFCKKILSYELSEYDFTLLTCFCHLAGNNDDDNIGMHDLEFLYEDISTAIEINRSISHRYHVLIENNFIDFNNDNGFMNPESWKMSDMAKKELLSELCIKANQNNRKKLILHESIKAKKMFYNPRETKEIHTLVSLLSDENFRKIQDRLDGKGMRKGFACLFSGPPGTGKTETAYQIAKETKRNIMLVDISQTKSCWFGESEKRIKEIFKTYKSLVDNSTTAPILLFNEADAVIGKRREFGSESQAVDQTENTIQNIILQEMENLSGILIATTNLTSNMDSAFERRFIYKIIFDRPSIESRKGIWNTMLPDLPENEAEELSGKYDLSGGQIENIARKIEVDSIIYGEDLAKDTLVHYCNDEVNNSFNTGKRIGFIHD